MKTLISTLVLVATILTAAESPEYKIKQDFVIYEATLNGKKITVFLSESRFEPDKHKITPAREVGVGANASMIWPMVDGHEAAGFRDRDVSIMKGILHLTRLAVSFDGKIVEAPKELIAHVFMPHSDTTFDSGGRQGMISISSDAKSVVVDLAVGDGAWSGHEAFTFSITGDCRLGVPPR